MIYVRRDPSIIPEKLLKVAERAQQTLETLPPDRRREFIHRKRHIWRRFKSYLRVMSHGKCWYSESPDPQSFFDVDHFRPKFRARRSDETIDRGYEWLAFSWENFRYSAQRCNQKSKDEESDEGVGKGDWFPLLGASPCACWDNRCENDERPVLLDPVRPEDVEQIDVLDDGRMAPAPFCVGSAAYRVTRSIELYGRNLPALTAARAKAMRDVLRLHATLLKTAMVLRNAPTEIADKVPLDEHMATLMDAVRPESAYSRAARAQLSKLPGGIQLLEKAERLARSQVFASGSPS
jgi:hypothetical protein